MTTTPAPDYYTGTVPAPHIERKAVAMVDGATGRTVYVLWERHPGWRIVDVMRSIQHARAWSAAPQQENAP